MNTHDLKQMNSIPNHRVLLDLLFTSIPTNTAAATLITDDVHHPALSFTLCLPSAFSHKQAKYILLDYCKSNLDAIFLKIQDLNFPVMYSISNVELIFNLSRYFS